VGRLEGRRPFGRTLFNESTILKAILKNWMRKHEIDQAEDRDSCRALVNAALNIWFA
jgi:predicted DNA-binding ArsR family transcriptional regulator